MNSEKIKTSRKNKTRLGYIIIALGIFLQMVPFVLLYSGIAGAKDLDMPAVFISFSFAAFVCVVIGGSRLRSAYTVKSAGNRKDGADEVNFADT